jgi:hypothetical protein
MNPMRRLLLLNASILACGTAVAAAKSLPTMRPSDSTAPYPSEVDRKFTASGDALPFRGNTMLSHIPLGTTASNALIAVRNTINCRSFSHCLAFTPPSSYHMTVIQGADDAVRKPGFWPADLPLNTPLADCTAHFERKLANFQLDCALPFRMRIVDFSAHRDSGATVRLEPADAAENKKIRGLRDRIADLLEIRAPGHEQYGFHVTLAYLVNWMNEAQTEEYLSVQPDCLKFLQKTTPVLELGAPEFCTFNDMNAFDMQFLVGQAPQRVPLSAADTSNA